MLSSVAEFERSIILERQREGIAIAKTKGKYKGRKNALTDDQVHDLLRRVGTSEKKNAIAKEFGISRVTVYAYLDAAKQTQRSVCA